MRVVVVVGSRNHRDKSKKENFFKDYADQVLDTLIAQFGLQEKSDSNLIFGNRFQVYTLLERVILDNPDEDMCLFYIGHGSEVGWSVTGCKKNQDIDLVTYEELRLLFAHHSGRIIWVNDCCYALAAEDALESHAGDHFLIGAMPRDRFGAPSGFLDMILQTWMSGGRRYQWWVWYDSDDGLGNILKRQEKEIDLYFGNPELPITTFQYT